VQNISAVVADTLVRGDRDRARTLLPVEWPYPLASSLGRRQPLDHL